MTHHLIIVDTDVVFHSEQPTVSQPEKREYNRVIGHNNYVFIVLVDGRFDQSVDVATMFTCRPYTVSSPLHLHCIYMRESFSLLMTMLISFYLLWIIS